MTRILGQDTAIATFSAALSGERMHHAWLFTGPEGVGKASAAFHFARAILAQAADPAFAPGISDVPDDHRIARLFDAGTHPDFRLLDRLPKDEKLRETDRREWPEGYERARGIVVDQVRTLTASFATAPSLSQRRVVIVDAVDDLERGAANALLKTLEEPPAGTIFLLVNHVAGRVLPTIRSRCRTLRFQTLGDDVMMAILRNSLPDGDPIERAALVRAGAGSAGRALAAAARGGASLDAQLDLIATTGDPANAQRLALAQGLTGKSAQARYEHFLERVPAFIAEKARLLHGEPLGQALRQWEAARSLAQSAVPASLDAHSVIFTLAGLVAALAPPEGSA